MERECLAGSVADAEDGFVRLPEAPRVGFEAKVELIAVMPTLMADVD
jgi:hypothetical protein